MTEIGRTMGKARISRGELSPQSNNTPIKLRRLDTSDASYRARYAAECDGISDESKVARIERRMRDWIKGPCHVGIVALAGERRVGHVDGEIRGTRLVIEDIYVENAYRSRGIGGRLLEAISAEARGRGTTVVEFDTESDNLAMQRVGRRLGFTLTRLYYERQLIDQA